MNIALVPKEHVQDIWPEVGAFIGASADYTKGRYTAGDALNMLTERGYVLWVAFDDTAIQGAAITSFIQYPRKKALHIMFLGGEKSSGWIDQGLKTLQHYAFDSGCDAVEASGRPGWARALRDDGFKPLWQTFELPTASEGIGA